MKTQPGLIKIRTSVRHRFMYLTARFTTVFVHLSATEVEIFLAQCKRKNVFWENSLLKLRMLIKIYRRK